MCFGCTNTREVNMSPFRSRKILPFLPQRGCDPPRIQAKSVEFKRKIVLKIGKLLLMFEMTSRYSFCGSVALCWIMLEFRTNYYILQAGIDSSLFNICTVYYYTLYLIIFRFVLDKYDLLRRLLANIYPSKYCRKCSKHFLSVD